MPETLQSTSYVRWLRYTLQRMMKIQPKLRLKIILEVKDGSSLPFVATNLELMVASTWAVSNTQVVDLQAERGPRSPQPQKR